MGLYDTLIDSTGKEFQTKALNVSSSTYYPGDFVEVPHLSWFPLNLGGKGWAHFYSGVWLGIVTQIVERPTAANPDFALSLATRRALHYKFEASYFRGMLIGLRRIKQGSMNKQGIEGIYGCAWAIYDPETSKECTTLERAVDVLLAKESDNKPSE